MASLRLGPTSCIFRWKNRRHRFSQIPLNWIGEKLKKIDKFDTKMVTIPKFVITYRIEYIDANDTSK